MQHFNKHSRTRLLALCLSAGLIMGGLSGCGSQDQGIADTVAGSTVSATADAADITAFPLPEGPEESTIYVEPVDGISDDFYRGMDVSAVLALENSGVKYYNFDGEEQDVFMTLAQAGVNYIRLRVWNDPYDENGNSYGGGNNDVATAITLGQRATQYGMKVCIDFHYSDFWADPKKQFVPKAWEGMDIEEKSDALYHFTLESLTQILDAGVDVVSYRSVTRSITVCPEKQIRQMSGSCWRPAVRLSGKLPQIPAKRFSYPCITPILII